MPRFFDSLTEPRQEGLLLVEADGEGSADVFYIPSAKRLEQAAKRLEQAELSTTDPAEFRVRLLAFNARAHRLTMYPKTTAPGVNFLKNKYSVVERITIQISDYDGIFAFDGVPSTEDEVMMMLEDLPTCFIKDFDYGLGFMKSHRFVVEAVEHLSACTEIVISDTCQTMIDHTSSCFYIHKSDFAKISNSIDRMASTSRDAAGVVNTVKTHNLLADKLGLPSTTPPRGRNRRRQILTEFLLNDELPASQVTQDAALEIVAKNTDVIGKMKPDRLVRLQKDIESVALDSLIKRYEDMMKKGVREGQWQALFNENPFILSLSFGYPVIKVKEQAYVGGRRLSGAGDKIADFLVKNSMTNNSAIVEIKTPKAGLLNKTQVRQGIYTPSADLVGSINQTLDQKFRFEREIAQIKENSEIYDIKSYSVHCGLIIGTMPTDDVQVKSFELFRGNSKNVEIITFDELLEKLNQLRGFLKPPAIDARDQIRPKPKLIDLTDSPF